FVGASAFAHKGGMHTHAIARNTASYEHIDPASVGNERRILISELSGQSTILAKTVKYDITHDKALMAKILNQVQDLEHDGYEFEAAEASFDLLVKKALGVYQPRFERLAYRVNVETDAEQRVGGTGVSPVDRRDAGPTERRPTERRLLTEATVKIRCKN